MPDTPIDERRFTDQEVREILKRAVSDRPSRALAKSEGLSLAELKSIGKEVGIDPQRLEDAARALSQVRNRGSRVFGAPTVLRFERRVDGEFDARDTPEIVSLIRRAMGRQGEVAERQSSVEWTAKGDSGERYVTLSKKDGTTTITGAANLANAAVLIYLPAGIVGFFASVVGLIKSFEDGNTVGIVLFLAILPILYPLLRTIFAKISGSEASKLQQAVDEVARLTEGNEP